MKCSRDLGLALGDGRKAKRDMMRVAAMMVMRRYQRQAQATPQVTLHWLCLFGWPAGWAGARA